MRQKPNRLFSRAAAMLLTVIMAFAGAQTAGADIKLTPHITYGDGLSSSNVTIQATTFSSIVDRDIETKTLTDGNQATFNSWTLMVDQIRIAVTSSEDITVTYSGVEGITQNGTGCSFSASQGTQGNSYNINITVSSQSSGGNNNTYTVRYSDGNFIGVSGSMDDQTFTVGVAQKLSPCTFTRSFGGTDYAFAGWAKTEGGSAVYSDGQEVTDIAAAGETITLYATWSTNGSGYSFTVHFDANGGTGTMADQSYSF